SSATTLKTAMIGSACTPELKAEPTTHDFGAAEGNLTFKIKVELAGLTITSASLEKTFNGAYSIASDSCSGKSFNHGDECSINLRFKPSGAGPFNTNIKIISSE